MDGKTKKEIVNNFAKKENISNVAMTLKNEATWKQEIIAQYLQPALVKLAEDRNLQFDDSELMHLHKKSADFSFYPNEWGRFRIYFVTGAVGYKKFYVGISTLNQDKVNIQKPLDCLKEGNNEWWPYGVQALNNCNWSIDTFVDLSNGVDSEFVKEVAYFLDSILSEIESKGINFEDCDKVN